MVALIISFISSVIMVFQSKNFTIEFRLFSDNVTSIEDVALANAHWRFK
jgi:hypothetical protein